MIDHKVVSTHLFANTCAEERLQEEDVEPSPGWDLRPVLFKRHQNLLTDAPPGRRLIR